MEATTYPAYIERSRRRIRRPILRQEVRHLAALAAELRKLREAAGLSRPTLGALSHTASTTIKDIELTRARTRQSTLGRLSRALSDTHPELGTPRALLGRLVAAAGPALAPESRYAAKVASRRERWARKGRFEAKPGEAQRMGVPSQPLPPVSSKVKTRRGPPRSSAGEESSRLGAGVMRKWR